MAWYVAPALETLRLQLNQAFPKRSKISDGGIGDARHQASKSSDHNPHVKDRAGIGVVTARDFTHDPQTGIDCEWLADTLVANKDPRIKYIIWNRRICSSKTSPWKWRPYSGANAHTKHLHLSVNQEERNWGDSAPWALAFPFPEGDDIARIDRDDNDILGLDLSAAASPTTGSSANTSDQLTPAVSTQDTPPADPQPPIESLPPTVAVVEKEAAPPGFFAGIKLKLSAWLASLGGTETLRQYSDDIQALGIPTGFLKYVVGSLLVGGVLWLVGYALWYAWRHLIAPRWLTVTMVKAAQTPNNVVSVAESDQIAELEAKGYVVARRR